MKNLNASKSSMREISPSELKHINGGLAWLVPVIIGIVAIVTPSVIGKDRNKNDNDPNQY